MDELEVGHIVISAFYARTSFQRIGTRVRVPPAAGHGPAVQAGNVSGIQSDLLKEALNKNQRTPYISQMHDEPCDGYGSSDLWYAQ